MLDPKVQGSRTDSNWKVRVLVRRYVYMKPMKYKVMGVQLAVHVRGEQKQAGKR